MSWRGTSDPPAKELCRSALSSSLDVAWMQGSILGAWWQRSSCDWGRNTWCIWVSLYFHHAFPKAGNKIVHDDVWSSPLFSWLIQTFGHVYWQSKCMAGIEFKSGSSRGLYIGSSELEGCSIIHVTFFFLRYSSLSGSSWTMKID